MPQALQGLSASVVAQLQDHVARVKSEDRALQRVWGRVRHLAAARLSTHSGMMAAAPQVASCDVSRAARLFSDLDELVGLAPSVMALEPVS